MIDLNVLRNQYYFVFSFIDILLFFKKQTHTHIREGEWGSNIKTHHKLYWKVMIT